MTDKATLIDRLEDAAERVREAGFRGHGTVCKAIAEAVEALKEQEPVRPKTGEILVAYCPECRKKVKWV